MPDKKIKEILVKIDKKKYKLSSDDNYIEHIKDDFEPEMVKLFKCFIKSQDIVFDIGANIGCTSILFGENSQKVYSFEPSKSTYAFLEKNISNSGLNNIITFNLGLGSENFVTQLTYSPDNRSGGFVSNLINATDDHIIEEIHIHKLDDFIKKSNLTRIDFIKIDAEGFEPKILTGATETVLNFKPVIILELNHWCLNAFQRISIPEFFDQLKELFPILYAVEGNTYLDLRNQNDSYLIMHFHILQMKYKTIIACFNEEKLSSFKKQYQYRLFK